MSSDNCPVMVHNLTFRNLRPCCVSVRDDMHFIAAGFENSHIYLWSLEAQQQSTTSSSSSNSQNNDDTIKIGTMFRLLAHSGPVYGIDFVRNNDLMLSCSEDTTIRLWCLDTKCNLIVYRGHNYPIWSISIGPRGDYFASASMDSTARLWQLDKICPLRIFCGHDNDVECVKFHPNGKYIATGSSDSTVRLWSTSDGKMVRLMVGHTSPIISLSFLPNGKFLASASGNGAIKVWNLTTNCVTNDLSIPASQTVSFSPEQLFVSSCGTDNVLRISQITESRPKERFRLDLNNHSAQLIHSVFLENNNLLVFDFCIENSSDERMDVN